MSLPNSEQTPPPNCKCHVEKASDCCASLISKITDNHWNKLYKCDMDIIIATAVLSRGLVSPLFG